MIRKLLFVLLMTSFFQFVHAQNFHAGIIGGISTTQVKGDQLSGFNKLGVIAGGFVNHSLTEKTSLQMEMYFIQKGSRQPVDPDNGNHYYIMRLSYFEVPVLFKYQVTTKLNFEAGLAFGVLVFSEELDEFGVRDDQPPFKKFEFSGSVGLSYPLGEKLFINSRFSTSIIPIRPFPGSPTTYFDKGQYNTVLSFTLHYQF